MNLAFYPVWPQSNIKEILIRKFETQGLLIHRNFGDTRKFPGSLKILAMFMYLLLLVFLSRSIVSFNCSEIQAVLYNQFLAWHLLLLLYFKQVCCECLLTLKRGSSVWPCFQKKCCMYAHRLAHTVFQEVGTSTFFYTQTALSSSL